MKVQVSVPSATEVAKLERKSLVAYIYIGPPIKSLQDQLGTEPPIQLDDAISTWPLFVEQVKSETNEAEIPLLTYSMKVNKETKMRIVTQVKQELRKVQALKIDYSSKKEAIEK